MVNGKIQKLKDSSENYIYPLTVSQAVYVSENYNLESKLRDIDNMKLNWIKDVDLTTNFPQDNQYLMYKDNKWQPAGLQTTTYYVEPDVWGLHTDGTNPVETTSGINSMMNWAVQQGYTEVVFPPDSVFLIDENNSVQPPSYLTINLNGSIFQINTNSLNGYNIVDISKGQKYTRMTNGTIIGDRYTHNYVNGAVNWQPNHQYNVGDMVIPTSASTLDVGAWYTCSTAGMSGGTEPTWNTASGAQTTDGTNGLVWTEHDEQTNENGFAVHIANNSQWIQIDNLELKYTTGDGIALATSPFGASPINLTSWVQGSINTSTGALQSDSTRVRLSNAVNIATNPVIMSSGYFGLYGDVWGNFGSTVPSRVFDAFFYDSNGNFLQCQPNMQFMEDVWYPTGTATVQIVLHQTAVPTDSLINIGVDSGPRYIFLERNHIHHNRRCGMSINGRFIYIRNNAIHDIKSGGTPPQQCIDIEDGYGLNENIFIENNDFRNCKIGVGFVSSQNVFVLNNLFRDIGYSTIWDKARKVVWANNIMYRSNVNMKGECIVANNNLFYSEITATGGNQLEQGMDLMQMVCDNYLHNSTLQIEAEMAWTVFVDGNVFYSDTEDTLNQVGDTIVLYSNAPAQKVSNCVFYGNNTTFSTMTGTTGWDFSNCHFRNIKAQFQINPGHYKGCMFDNAYPSLLTTGDYTFSDCVFTNSTGNALNINSGNSTQSILVKDCKFSNQSGNAINVGNVSLGYLEIRHNVFDYTNVTSAVSYSIINLGNTFSATSLVINDNTFKSGYAMTGITYGNTMSVSRNLFQNNMMDTVTQSTYYAPGFYSNSNFIGGVYEPFSMVDSLPTYGNIPVGMTFTKRTPTAGGFMGWVCTTAGFLRNARTQGQYYHVGDQIQYGGSIYNCIYQGYASGSPTFTETPNEIVYDSSKQPSTWLPNHSYNVGDCVIPTAGFSGAYYSCTQAGLSGGTEPTWANTVTDNQVKWQLHGACEWQWTSSAAVFKTYGNISN